jgi:hypothetical protein
MKIEDIKLNKRFLYVYLTNKFQYLQVTLIQIAIQEKDKLINNIVNKMYVC